MSNNTQCVFLEKYTNYVEESKRDQPNNCWGFSTKIIVYYFIYNILQNKMEWNAWLFNIPKSYKARPNCAVSGNAAILDFEWQKVF